MHWMVLRRPSEPAALAGQVKHYFMSGNQTESERKSLEARFKSMPQGFIATLDQFADCLAKG